MYDVLVVDDDAAIAEFLEVILADKGYRVRSAGDGPQAMEILQRHPPRLLLLDLVLQTTSAHQFAMAMRETVAKDVPIVLMSAHSDAAKEAAAIGAAAHLRKPFDLDALYACVAKYVGTKDSG